MLHGKSLSANVFGARVVTALSMITCLSCDASPQEIPHCDAPPTTPYIFNIPDHFPELEVPDNNPTTEQGVALGKRLYYDEMLSEGGPLEGRACASCHSQEISFTRNSSGTAVLLHTNLGWSSYFLWNGAKSGSLEDVMAFEIAEFFGTDIALFNSDPTYQRMSCEAFGTADISATEMADAMAQWMRTLVSYRSKYDQYIAGDVQLTELESEGEILFNSNMGDCFNCHSTPLTTDLSFHNNGLQFEGEQPTAFDMGRFNVTDDPDDMGKFKTPTLRNIALTAPYMHDGRFGTLEEVIEHYNSGVRWSPTLDTVMQTSDRRYGLLLTKRNIDALVAFLNTFTDTAFTTDAEFSSPFQ